MQIATIGLDVAKNVFQVHGIDGSEKVFVRKQLRRSQVLAFFKALPPCLVGMRLAPRPIIGRVNSRSLGGDRRNVGARRNIGDPCRLQLQPASGDRMAARRLSSLLSAARRDRAARRPVACRHDRGAALARRIARVLIAGPILFRIFGAPLG